ncbi:reverse transcriptase/ribonuclease h/methyltransferase [Plakobranchus ocellatus]|uniref:Reverse transcriptase/ribonuclease h/methyltransferase n=1 Tax=Plakobranchus ocellatus TaxID=259542 RepID=A0AAV3YUQ2_9GAST|nr:reverse transcriptase/ribonuclease h/methyltransferase [Plakobranchus ocellatus]
MKSGREVNGKTILLRSYKKKLTEPLVGTQCLDGIRHVLDLAGIDLTLFTAHNTGAANISAAARTGLPLRSMLNSAGGSSECTFARFYRKDIQINFGQALRQAYMTD